MPLITEQNFDLDFPIGHSMEELPKEDIFASRKQDLSYRDLIDDTNFSMNK